MSKISVQRNIKKVSSILRDLESDSNHSNYFMDKFTMTHN